MKVTKAVIPAAGLGTRVLPATKSMPKEMLPIVDKPAIQYIVEEAVRAVFPDAEVSYSRNTMQRHLAEQAVASFYDRSYSASGLGRGEFISIFSGRDVQWESVTAIIRVGFRGKTDGQPRDGWQDVMRLTSQ